MPVFRDADHLYRVFGALFERLRAERDLTQKLTQNPLVVRFVFTEPAAEITVDLRCQPLAFYLGPCALKPEVEMTQSADVAHRFWLGQVNVPQAIATRQVIARGSVPKALALLPAIRPVFDLYPVVLREIGEAALLPMEKKTKRAPRSSPFARLLRGRTPAVVPAPEAPAPRIPLLEESGSEPSAPRAPLPPREERALKIEMLRRMRLIRAFEKRMAEEFAAGRLPAEALHLSIGQEACAVGACFALQAEDYMTTTHRGHGHMLARGADPNAMAAELLGKAGGLCQGLGGTMHVTDASLGALGANGIVGASSLIATGAALSARLRRSRQIALAFMGDGATAQGMFHEALNFAAVFDLPVIFFVENNQYAEFTPLRGHTRLKRLAERALGHGLPGVAIDGNDVWEVYQTVQRAAERARNGDGPTLIEALTYRWSGHTEGETARYRPDEEIAEWKQRDPIVRWEARLQETGLLTPQECAALREEARRRVDEALAFAHASPEPQAGLLLESVFAPEPASLYRPQPASPAARTVSVSTALWEALAEEMGRDERVYILGEDVRAGGYFAVTAGLVDEFGPQRVIDTPISEYAIVGSSVGAAMTGMRPVAEIEFSDFITCAMDPLVNQAAKLRFMSGGQYRLPLVVRTPGGGGIGMAAQHSQSLEAWLMHVPGLILIAPGTAYDAKGLLKAAIRSNNPVVFFENKLLYAESGLIPEGEYLVPIGVADVKRRGEDVTLVAVGATVPRALEAARHLEGEGISVEVVDVRTLAPCDWDTILRSAHKTRRVITLEDGVLSGGFGAECAARLQRALWGRLKAPVQRLAGWDVPIPYNRTLENAIVPNTERIVEAIRSLMRR